MRSTATVDWQILDCEEDEWQQALATAGAARAGMAQESHAQPATPRQAAGHRLPTRRWRLVLCLALAAALLAVITVRILRDAEAGAALIRQDIANVVTLETVKAATDHLAAGNDGSVQSVDFRGAQAMVQVVVTRTAPSHLPVVQRETRFYVQDAHGWQRAGLIHSFWGGKETLDTPHLHFVFHALDRSAVQAIAADADALYVAVHEALGLPLPVESPALTVTVVLDPLPPAHLYVLDDGIQLQSPVLLGPYAGISDAAILGGRLRFALVDMAFAQATAQSPYGRQWDAMAEGLLAWLVTTDDLSLSGPVSLLDKWQSKPKSPHVAPLDTLLLEPHYDTAILNITGRIYLAATAQDFIDFAQDTYGLAAIGRLYQGLSHYDNWNALAPAAFGVSAQQLEYAWHASPRKPS